MSEEIKPNTAKVSNIPTRARPHRPFTRATIRQVAKMVAEQLTESEAVRLLGFEPKAWFVFKSRGKNDERFAADLELFDAEHNADLLKGIRDCGAGKGMKQPDWRAKAWLLGTKHPKRFSDAASRVTIETPPMPPLDLTLIMTTLEKVYAGQVVDVGPVKALPAPPQAGPRVDGVQFVGPKPKPVKIPKLTFTTPTPAPDQEQTSHD